ncbi:MAG TPA: hypothetical protein ENI61_07270 [Ignavibacteria bacterium]|nr:hypothetical protein [Ignavibacteria bacterium]
MGTVRQDFLKECMSDVGNSPLDEFNKYFCIQCQNVICVRAGGNNSLFKKRTSSWEDSLFNRVSRAKVDDHRFDSIRSKNFLPIIKSTVHEIRHNNEIPILNKSKMQQKIKITDSNDITIKNVPEKTIINTSIESNIEIKNKFNNDIQNTQFKQGSVLSNNESEIKKPGSIFVFDDE